MNFLEIFNLSEPFNHLRCFQQLPPLGEQVEFKTLHKDQSWVLRYSPVSLHFVPHRYFLTVYEFDVPLKWETKRLRAKPSDFLSRLSESF